MSKRMQILREEGRSKEGVTEYIWHENRVGGGYLGGRRGPASAMGERNRNRV